VSSVALIDVDTRLPRVGDPISEKQALRREMRAMRRALPDQDVRSERLWQVVRALPEVEGATVVMAFESVPGEPATRPFIEWCRRNGKTVALPDDDPPFDPSSIDVVIVPGVAFTAAGDRLGQGGGWYDRFLDLIGPDCVTVGVGFSAQLLPSIPTEPHDVRLDMVVTDAGRCVAGR
jgi:5-formyltetrahydrofolate cyclo-ligase